MSEPMREAAFLFLPDDGGKPIHFPHALITEHGDGAVTVIRHDATLGTPPHDDADMAPVWTEDTTLRALWRHFAAQSWAPIPQVTVAHRDLTPTPAAQPGLDLDSATDRRIDLLCVRTPRRDGVGPLETLAIEVKVTRQDFYADIRNPAKQAAWRKAATRHAYATPAGMVTADEIPEGSGLLAVKHSGIEWVTRAPYQDGHAPQLPPRVLVTLSHRIANLEAGTRGWHSDPAAAGTPQELRAAALAARKDAQRAERTLARAEGQRDAWKAAYAALSKDGHPCRWCSRPVKPLNAGEHGFKSWRHRDQADDQPCALAETAELEREARDAYEAADARTQAQRLTHAHRYAAGGFDEAAEREPWRAFMPYDYGRPRRLLLRGPQPADVQPS